LKAYYTEHQISYSGIERN